MGRRLVQAATVLRACVVGPDAETRDSWTAAMEHLVGGERQAADALEGRALVGVLAERAFMARVGEGPVSWMLVRALSLAHAAGHPVAAVWAALGDGAHLQPHVRAALALHSDLRIQLGALGWPSQRPETLRQAWNGAADRDVHLALLRHPALPLRAPRDLVQQITGGFTRRSAGPQRVAPLADVRGGARMMPSGRPVSDSLVLRGLIARPGVEPDVRALAIGALTPPELTQALDADGWSDTAFDEIARLAELEGSSLTGPTRGALLVCWCTRYPDHPSWHDRFDVIRRRFDAVTPRVLRALGARLPVGQPHRARATAGELLAHADREVRVAALGWLGQLGRTADSEEVGAPAPAPGPRGAQLQPSPPSGPPAGRPTSSTRTP